MIIQMTTVHPRDDSRILHKQARTLTEKTGEQVAMFVQDGEGDGFDANSRCLIVDTGSPLSRLKRMTVGAWRMIRAVQGAKPKLVIFHDPELIPWALILEFGGIPVIYDVHEDYPGAVSRNRRIPKGLRWIAAVITGWVEFALSRFFTGVIAVSPEIARRFPRHKTVVVRNSPLLHELAAPSNRPYATRPADFGYVGTINEDRNIYMMVDCVSGLGRLDSRFRLAGMFDTTKLEESVKSSSGWSRVLYDRWLDRAGVRELLSDVRAGLLLIKPIEHELTGMPIKMCEYMAASIPVIASDFPFWRTLVADTGAGLVVNPNNRDEIIQAMNWILENPEKAEEMGRRGRELVLTRFNWDIEAVALLEIVNKALNAARH
jgi:glycosyltransferase involved in cell wall biosynthesis